MSSKADSLARPEDSFPASPTRRTQRPRREFFERAEAWRCFLFCLVVSVDAQSQPDLEGTTVETEGTITGNVDNG